MVRKGSILKSILLFIFLSTFISCNDWLEVYPTNGLIYEEFWHTKEDVEAVLMGAYRAFADMDQDLLFYGEVRADMVSTPSSAPNDLKDIKDGIIQPDNGFCKWDKFYEVINYCNLVLGNAEAVMDDDPTLSEVQVIYYQSEARFLRALVYFYLVRIFDRVPFITEPTLADDSRLYYPNVSGDSILTVIDEDLSQVGKNSLPLDYGVPLFNKGRARYISVQALQADIALWQFRYNDCLTHIKNVEENSPYGLKIVPLEEWKDIYFPGNSDESIFEFQFSGIPGESNHLFDYTYGTTIALEASDFALDIFATEIGSPRKSFSFDRQRITKFALTNTGDLRGGLDQSAANLVIYRNTDLVLMKAEALAMLGQFDEAQELISMVNERNNPYNPYPEIERKKSSFEDAILLERAKEFAFEGKRWFDLLRLGRRNNYQRKDVFIEHVVIDFAEQDKFIKRSKLKDPNGWYLPIFDKELENNPQLDQNPYYSSFTE